MPTPDLGSGPSNKRRPRETSTFHFLCCWAQQGPTKYADWALRHVSRPTALSEDLSVIRIRASRKIRIFVYRSGHVYYVTWFDRNHPIVPDD